MNRLLRRQRAALALVIAFSVCYVGVALADIQHADQPLVGLDVSPNNGAGLADSQTVTVTGSGFSPNSQVVLTEQAPLAGGVTASSDTLGTVNADGAGSFTTTITVTRTFTDVSASAGTVNCAAVSQCFVDAFGPGTGNNSHHTISFSGLSTTSTAPSTTTTLPATTTTLPATTTTLPATTTTAPATTTSTTNPGGTTSTTNPGGTTSTTNPGGTTSTTNPGGTTSTTNPGGTTSTTNPGGTTTTNPGGTTTTVPGSTTTTGATTTTTNPNSQCATLRAARVRLNAQITAIEASLSQQSIPADQRATIVAQLEASRAAGNAQLDALLAAC
jgi:hypothetical protein